MSSTRLVDVAALALAAIGAVFPVPARAGLNAGAVATLTWSATGVVSDLTPSGGTRTLYLRCDGLHSLKAIETLVLWTPTGSDDPAYQLTNWNAPSGTSCQWLLRGSSLKITASTDSSFRIAVSSDVDSTCGAGNALSLTFSNPPSGPFPPGQFALAFARTVDTNGATDTLALGSRATILHGTIAPAPALNGISPGTGYVGWLIDHYISGFNFVAPESVALVRAGSGPIIGSVQHLSTSKLKVHFAFTAADTGLWTLCVTNPGGRFATNQRLMSVVILESGGMGIAGGGTDRVLITVRPGALPLTGSRPITPAQLISGNQQILNALVTSNARSIQCLWPELSPQKTAIVNAGGLPDTLFDFGRVFELGFDTPAVAADALAILRGVGDIVSANPSLRVGGIQLACNPSPLTCGATSSPNDPDFSVPETSQWYLLQTQTEAEAYYGRQGEDTQTDCVWNNERPLASPDYS